MSNENDEKRLDRLVEQLNRLHRWQNNLRATLDLIPIYRSAKLLNTIVKLTAFLYEISERLNPKVLAILADFLRCKDEKLAELGKDDLIGMLEFLNAFADIERTAIDAKIEDLRQSGESVPQDLLDRRAQIGPFRQEIDRALKDISELEQDEAVERIKQLKQNLRQVSPLIIGGLLLYLGSNVEEMTKGLQKLGPSLADQAAKTAIRLLVKKLIAESVKALIRRYFGEAVAKQVNPFVGTALSLLEFGMTVALLEGIKALNHLIDAVLIHLIRQLAEMGRQWPTFSSKFIFLEGDIYRNKIVWLRPYIQCYRITEDGTVVRGEPCPLKFDPPRLAAPQSTAGTEAANYWEIQAVLDMESIQDSPCRKDAALCLIYINVHLRDPEDPTAEEDPIGVIVSAAFGT